MAFIKRLGWYLVGLSVGIIFLAFFLKKKSDETGTSFCYFPNCRVLKDIRSKTFSKTENPNDTIAFANLSPEIKELLINGSVDFKRSDTKARPCAIYFIENDDESLTLKVQNCPDKAIIERL